MKIAILTSGGDAPGMNCAIRAIVRKGVSHGCAMVGVKRGFRGLYESLFEPMTARSVGGIINQGGTILRSTRFTEFYDSAIQKVACKNLLSAGIDGLVVIGGDGSAAGALSFFENTLFPVVHIPASIDNDLFGTDSTVGFDTAVNTAVGVIDKIRDTATSHERIFVIEVMGREHGFLGLDIAIASGAEIALLPEFPIKWDRVKMRLDTDYAKGKITSLVILAEGAGKAHEVAATIASLCPDREVRYVVLGYLQRGGSPTFQTRALATVFGNEAVTMLLEGDVGKMVAIKNNHIDRIPLQEVVSHELPFPHEKLNLLETMAV
ncbi:MAG: ATP-dependent 6-phosphofructokinase [Candidatus Ratteibacteria bacterium]